MLFWEGILQQIHRSLLQEDAHRRQGWSVGSYPGADKTLPIPGLAEKCSMREPILPQFINLVLYLSSFATFISVSGVTPRRALLLPNRDGHIPELPFPPDLQD